MHKTIKKIHLEITERCNANCTQCMRTNKEELNNELSLNDIQYIVKKNKSVFKDIEWISMCGNYGDPIVATDILQICQYLESEGIARFISTNGSMRTEKWWSDFAATNTKVIFAIDGLKDTNHIYRRNTDFDKIIENAKAFISNGGVAEWQFIVFSHNEHQIEEAKKIASEIGFNKFFIKKAGRLDNNVKKHTFIRPTFDYIKNETYMNNCLINCKYMKQEKIYISAEGLMLPCCWLAAQLYTPNYKEDKDKLLNIIKIKDNINIFKNSILKILEGEVFSDIYNSWSKTLDNGRLSTCALQCGVKAGSRYVEF